MSGKHCHLCQMSEKEICHLFKRGKEWTWDEMRTLATDFLNRLEKNANAKPTMGVKEEPWWDFIPITHYVVPLLHCLIGIGNDILTSKVLRYRQ